LVWRTVSPLISTYEVVHDYGYDPTKFIAGCGDSESHCSLTHTIYRWLGKKTRSSKYPFLKAHHDDWREMKMSAAHITKLFFSSQQQQGNPLDTKPVHGFVLNIRTFHRGGIMGTVPGASVRIKKTSNHLDLYGAPSNPVILRLTYCSSGTFSASTLLGSIVPPVPVLHTRRNISALFTTIRPPAQQNAGLCFRLDYTEFPRSRYCRSPECRD
jgi:hypothetical protein